MDKIISSDLVEMLVHNLKGHTLLKDASNGKYLDANDTHLAVYGLDKPAELIGYTVHDLNNLMSQMWHDNAQQVVAFEEQVLSTGKPVIHPRRVWLNANGYVWAHHMSKFPVIGTNNTTTAILSLGDDLTRSLTLQELYLYYVCFYKNKRVAILKFMEHVKIKKFFYDMPTDAEIKVLVTKAKFHLNKAVALHLKLELSTIESCINKLGKKTSDLTNVINVLRLW